MESATSSEIVAFWLAPWETYRLVFNGLGWEVRSSDWLMAERIYYLTARSPSPLALPTSTGEQLPLDYGSVYFLQHGAAGWDAWLIG
ncbi:hypothetical protein [Longispora fulva]|uniref:Uncharacterized protein n=1 Tax=Longispora fulva TaxID=619741 RepID=A0A8J7GQZ5_9ACTN|nr:hypothetical protein [Longispora fulva]MBG6136528.1 hypothetical protein [Longispora fulva]